MPFDGKNFTETKPDAFSLAGFISWIERQPPETTYDWDSVDHDGPDGGCLILRYGTAAGCDPHDMHDWFYLHGLLSLASIEPWTYGAALERARALQSRAA